MLPVNLYIRRQIMKRKVILLLLIVVTAVTAVSFTACDNKGEYADLVGIRVNGRRRSGKIFHTTSHTKGRGY